MDKNVHTLFEIGNSDFGGVVRYTAYHNDSRLIVDANWCHGRGGHQYRGLKKIEKLFAYGYKLDKNKLVICSLKKRPLTIINFEDNLKCQLLIDGKPSILDHVYVTTTKNTMGLPSVDHIDIYGKIIENGEEIHEVYHK